MTLTVLVYGGRTYGEVTTPRGAGREAIAQARQVAALQAACLHTWLDNLHHGPDGPIGTIVQGGATGADRLAKMWAYTNRVRCREHKAQWKSKGKAAGPIRNQLMLDINRDISMALECPGGDGTADMGRRVVTAIAQGRPITRIVLVDNQQELPL